MIFDSLKQVRAAFGGDISNFDPRLIGPFNTYAPNQFDFSINFSLSHQA